MDENKNVVPFDVIPQIHTGSFLTKEQAEQFKEAFKDLTVVVRCKDCISFNSYFVECNKGHNPRPPYDRWFCADGEKDGSQIKRPQKTFWDSLSEADLMEPMHHFEE